jgi:hypothetical protein
MQRLVRAAAGALARCSDGGLGAAGAHATSATRAFHATGSAWEPLSQAHRCGMSATTVLCVRKGDQARGQLCFLLASPAALRCTPARRARGTAAPPGAPCVRRRRRSRRCHAQSRPLTPLSRHGATPSSPGGHDWRRAGDNGGRDRQAEREESAAHRHGRHRRLCWCAACRNGAQTYPAAVSLALLRAGATADAFTLFERLETKLEEHPARAPAALCAHAARRADRSVATRAPPRLDRRGSSRARAWSWPRRGAWTSSCAAWTCVYSASLRCFSPTRAHACCSAVPSARAQAVMVVADETHSLQITGTGDVLEPHDGIIGAQSASPAAQTPSYCNCCADAPSPATSHRLGRAVRAGGRARAHRHPGNGCHDNRWVSPDVLAAFSVSCADAARVQPSAP